VQAAQQTTAKQETAFVEKDLAGDASRRVQLSSTRSCERTVAEKEGQATLGASAASCALRTTCSWLQGLRNVPHATAGSA
jgi:hypothetical protein